MGVGIVADVYTKVYLTSDLCRDSMILYACRQQWIPQPLNQTFLHQESGYIPLIATPTRLFSLRYYTQIFGELTTTPLLRQQRAELCIHIVNLQNLAARTPSYLMDLHIHLFELRNKPHCWYERSSQHTKRCSSRHP